MADLKPKIWPKGANGKPKKKPIQKKGLTDQYRPKPTPSSSWVKTIAHRDGIFWLTVKKGGIRYGFQDRTGKLYNDFRAALAKGDSVGRQYWNNHLRNRSFLKRK